MTIDNLLTEEALLKLRQYYEDATVFWDAKPDGPFTVRYGTCVKLALLDAQKRINVGAEYVHESIPWEERHQDWTCQLGKLLEPLAVFRLVCV